MLYKYDAGEDDMKPNVISFTAVLNAVANCQPVHQHAEEDTATDGEAFHTDTEATGRGGPYEIALATYDELWNDVHGLKIKPDHFTFATMLQVVNVHTDKASAERRQFVERIFDDACAGGQVSSLVVRAVREACPTPDLLSRMFGSKKLANSLKNVDQLDKDWTRNVGREKRFRLVDDRTRRTTKPSNQRPSKAQ